MLRTGGMDGFMPQAEPAALVLNGRDGAGGVAIWCADRSYHDARAGRRFDSLRNRSAGTLYAVQARWTPQPNSANISKSRQTDPSLTIFARDGSDRILNLPRRAWRSRWR